MRVQFKDRVWDKDAVQELIDTNDAAVSRALLVIYANQTADEQRERQTKLNNGIGFTGRDAEFLTDVAQKWQHWGRWASQKQLNAVRRCVRKYWRQLLEDMIDKGGVKVVGRQKKEAQPDLVAEEFHQVIEPQMSAEGSW